MEIEKDADRRDDIRQAFEKLSEPAKEPVAPPPEVKSTPIAPEKSEQKELPGIGDKPKSGKPPEVKAEKPPEQKAERPPEDKPSDKSPEKVPAPKKIRPPIGWDPAAREKWDALPPEVQKEAVKRERQVEQALQESASARQFEQRFRETVAPYEPMFKAQNVDAVQAAQFLFQQYSTLATAPMEVRARTLAGWINSFIPGEEGLTALAKVLADGPQAAAAPVQQQPYRDPRVDELYSRLSQAEEMQRRSLMQKAEEEVAEIENEEFYDDVRLIAADLIEVAGRNGLKLTPRDAYNRALMMHPTVSKVIEQRQAASQVADTQRSMQAASSVKSSPAPMVDSGQPGEDLRSAIEAAYALHTRR